jgi:hypothetical protein
MADMEIEARQGTSFRAASASSQAASSSVRWGGVALYVALAFGISWAVWLGLGALGV